MRETWDLGRSNLQPHDGHDILKFRGPVRKESNNEVQKIRTFEILDLNILCGQITRTSCHQIGESDVSLVSHSSSYVSVYKLRLHIHAIQWPGHQLAQGPDPASRRA